MPDPTTFDGTPHLLEKNSRVVAGIEDIVAPADNLLAAIARHRAKRVIDIDDATLRVGDAHQRVLVERQLKVSDHRHRFAQLLLGLFARADILHHAQCIALTRN